MLGAAPLESGLSARRLSTICRPSRVSSSRRASPAAAGRANATSTNRNRRQHALLPLRSPRSARSSSSTSSTQFDAFKEASAEAKRLRKEADLPANAMVKVDLRRQRTSGGRPAPTGAGTRAARSGMTVLSRWTRPPFATRVVRSTACPVSSRGRCCRATPCADWPRAMRWPSARSSPAPSPVARAECGQLAGLLREKSAFALKLPTTQRILPHAHGDEVSSAAGCDGLRSRCSIRRRRRRMCTGWCCMARERHGELDALPFSEIVKGVAAWQGRRRRQAQP